MERNFTVNSKSGSQFEIVTEIVVEKNNMGEYTKELQVIEARIDGKEIPKNKSGKPFLMKVTSLYHKKEKHIVLSLKYDAWEFIKKTLGLKIKQESGYVVVGKDLEKYYLNDFLGQSQKIIEEMKAEENKTLKNTFKNIKPHEIIEISKHSSYGISISHEAQEHEFFKNAEKKIEESKIEINNEFQTDSNLGDYSITKYYKIPFNEFKSLVRDAENILEKVAAEKAKKDAEKKLKEQKIFEKAKQTGEPQIISTWSEPCNDPREECNSDNVVLYAMPDGTTTTKRHHTF
ncbi:MAG: hypothetical protein MJA82_06270 [Clostridia bacterium]|nr:hypothetical protein [Clostridia bacterium]